MLGNQNVRRKLLKLVLFPTVLLSGLLGYFGFRDFQLLREGLVEHGISQATHLADLAEFGLVTGNLQQLSAAAKVAFAQGAIAVRIYDADGRAVISSGAGFQRSAHANHAVPGACGESRDLFVFCAPVRIIPLSVEHFTEFGGGVVSVAPIGHIELALSAKELGERRSLVLVSYAAVLIAVMTMGFLLARRVERQLAHPIEGLHDAVERVGHGDLAVRVREDAGGELLILQRGFNAMARSLACNYEDQERRIAGATARLRFTLQELEERNRELNVEKQRAEAANVAKGRFLAVMSHEIRTPLSGMIGMLALLEESGLTQKQTDYVRHVESAAEALRLLIDEILDYSRIEAGKLAVFSDPMRLRCVVEEVVHMLTPSAADKGVEFIAHIRPDVPDNVIGDALRLRQVLINLTANAIKFTERGRVSIYLGCAGGEERRPRLRFVVEDTGIGIPEAQQSQVFESFAQVDSGPTRRYGGSGLGAAVARELVHLMGGEIGFSSVPGVGSRFWFELPMAVDPDAVKMEVPLLGKRAAVLERDDVARAALVDLLAALGAQVTELNGGEQMLPSTIGDAVDYLFLCETGSDDSMVAMARNCRAQARCICHVVPITGSGAAPHYDCNLHKPVTRPRLLKALGEQSSHQRFSDLSPGPRSLRVLVAEDDEINARVVASLLQKMGHQVIRTRDGREALEQLARQKFDIAILDIRMPEIDGATVAMRWRALEREAGGYLPLVALTANGSPDDMKLCRDAGIDEFLLKPINSKTLAEVLERRVLGRCDRSATSVR